MESYVDRIKTSAEHLPKDVFHKKSIELDNIINVTFLPNSRNDTTILRPFFIQTRVHFWTLQI